MSPVRALFRDLWFHLKRTRCIIRRRHLDPRPIGDLTKKGYRPVAVEQCHFCGEIRVKLQADVIRFGGKS